MAMTLRYNAAMLLPSALLRSHHPQPAEAKTKNTSVIKWTKIHNFEDFMYI